MSRAALETELSALRNATPSRIASFNERRTVRIAEIEAQLAALPVEVTRDEFLERVLSSNDAASPENRRAASWR